MLIKAYKITCLLVKKFFANSAMQIAKWTPVTVLFATTDFIVDSEHFITRAPLVEQVLLLP